MSLPATAKYFVITGALLLATLVAYGLAYPQLPAQIPIHWNAQGVVNGYGPRAALLALGPGAMLGMLLLFGLLRWLSPRHYEVDSFRPTYLYLMLVLMVLLAYLFGVLLWAALVGPQDVHRLLLGGLGVLFMLIGNVLGKVRRNFFIGIRTPWTLASERVWYATHRMAAKTFVAGGLVSLLLLPLGLPFWGVNAMLITTALLPVAYSLLYYKRLERRGELDGPSV
jgi:uncharacterized membrane protein